MVGDRKGIADADRAAKRKALDIIEGKIIAGSVAQLIERFRDEIAPTPLPGPFQGWSGRQGIRLQELDQVLRQNGSKIAAHATRLSVPGRAHQSRCAGEGEQGIVADVDHLQIRRALGSDRGDAVHGHHAERHREGCANDLPQLGSAFLPVVAAPDRHLPQPGLRRHVHLPDRLSRGRGAAVSYRWQDKGRRARHQRQAQEGPGRCDEIAGVVDQVSCGRRARRRDALGAAPVPVRQFKGPGVYKVRNGIGVAGRHVRMDSIV